MNNIFDKIPTCLKQEIVEPLIEQDSVRIERIISKGHKSPEAGWYDQDQNEWVMVLRGEAILAFEGASSITLKEGDFVDIKAHRKHKVEWTDPAIETIWLAVRYSD